MNPILKDIKTYEIPQQPFKLMALIGFAVCILFCWSTAFAYSSISWFNPIVYLNAPLILVYALVLAVGMRVIRKLFLVVERRIALSMAMICALLTLHFSWTAFIVLIADPGNAIELYFTAPLLVLRPSLVLDSIGVFYTDGAWEIFGGMAKGPFVAGIWLIEAALILIFPYLMVKRQKVAPFSTAHSKWYRKFVLTQEFESIIGKREFLAHLNEAVVPTIGELGHGIATRFSRISVYYLKDETIQYLTIENILRDRGGKKETGKDVIHLMAISTEDAEVLIKEYRGKKAFFLDY